MDHVDTTYGFTAKQIITRIQNYAGSSSTEFDEYVLNSINTAQFSFAKKHAWNYLFRTNIPLTLVNGTAEYELNIANTGFNIESGGIRSIFDPNNSRYLKKISHADMRRLDPNSNDDGVPTSWAIAGDQKIVFYPPNLEATALLIDAQVQPTPVTNFESEDPIAFPGARLDIPYKYQESFYVLMLAMVLDREDDDRANRKFDEARRLIREDIDNDMTALGDTEDPRIKHHYEAAADGNYIGIHPFHLDD